MASQNLSTASNGIQYKSTPQFASATWEQRISLGSALYDDFHPYAHLYLFIGRVIPASLCESVKSVQIKIIIKTLHGIYLLTKLLSDILNERRVQGPNANVLYPPLVCQLGLLH